MLDEIQAQEKVKEYYPGSVPNSWVRYNDLYLVSVKRPEIGEEDFDPFFSVDVNTGEVSEFSVLPVLDEVFSLKWTDV